MNPPVSAAPGTEAGNLIDGQPQSPPALGVDPAPDDGTGGPPAPTVRRSCDLCEVKNFAIGGRDTEGRFAPLFQLRADPVEAASRIGRLAWCGRDAPQFVARIFRVICEVVAVEDGSGHETAAMLLCGRCKRAVLKHAHVEAAA